MQYNEVEYVRKNKYTDNRALDKKINRVKKRFSKYIQEYINNTPIETVENNFISDYQRRVYNVYINKNDRINYVKGILNYNVFRDYLPERLRCYMVDKQLLKTKN